MAGKNGGFSDWNRDGKVTLDEQIFTNLLLQQRQAQQKKKEPAEEVFSDDRLEAEWNHPELSHESEPIPQKQPKTAPPIYVKPKTMEEYRQKRKELHATVRGVVAVALLLSILPVVILTAAIITALQTHGAAAGIVVVLFCSAAGVALFFIWRGTVESIREDCKNLRMLKTDARHLRKSK